MAKKKFYAVRSGRKVGIFESWDECRTQTEGFPGSSYKSFLTKKEAEEFLNESEEVAKSSNTESEGIIAYVDGSYDESKQAFSYGILILMNDKRYIEYGKQANVSTDMIDVLGKIIATTKAMEYTNNFQCDNKVVTIYHDYEGIEKWCTGEWESDNEKAKEYLENYKYYSRLMNINFKKVEAHFGDKYKDTVNQLAKYALNDAIFEIVNKIEYHSCNSHNTDSFNTIKELNISAKEAIQYIEEICSKNAINMRIKDGTNVNTDKHLIIYFDKNYLNSEIHLHISGKGLTININQGKCNELNCLIVHNLITQYNINKVEEKRYVYRGLEDDKISDVVSNLELFNDDSKYEFAFSKECKHIKYSFIIKAKITGEKISVYIYTNNTLEVRGKKYLLWEDVCYIIEKSLDISLDDIIGRINVGTDLKFNHDNVDKCDQLLHSELGEDIIGFMYSHDYNVILSIKCSLEHKIRVPDYGIYIDPLTKALEGYLKQLIVHLNIVKKFEIKKSSWNLSEIFNVDRSLKVEYHSCLNADTSKKSKQLDILKAMCDKMWDIRNPINHSDYRGTLSYNNYDDAVKEYISITELIKESYSLLI